MKTRLISLVVAAGLLAGSFAGCAKSAEKKPDSPSATQSTSKDDMSKKLTITWMGISLNPTAQEGTFPEKLLEEKFNVDIKPTFLDSEGYKNKRPIMLASGQIPDFLYLMDPADVQQTVNSGAIIEVPYEKIKSIAPKYFEAVTKEAPDAWLNSYYNGKNWGVPNANPEGNNPKAAVWRMDWLKNVGINKVPETLDEMETAFDKFVNNDPDKNGKKDTYALSGDIKNFQMCFTEIFGAYGVLPFDWMKKDGKVAYGASLPETKKVLERLASWYKKGYIHPDFITDDFSKTIKDKFQNGKVGYMVNFGLGDMNGQSANSMISVMKKLFPEVELAAAGQPKGPDGKAGTFAWGTGGHIMTFGKQVANEPEKEERILKIIETIQTDEALSLQLRVGDKGKQWDINPSPDDYTQYTIKQLAPYDDRKQSDAQAFRAYLLGPSFFAPIPGTWALNDKYETKNSKTFKQTYQNSKNGLSDLFLKPDSLPSASKYYNDLRNKELLTFARIISGEKPISLLDDFLKEWSSQGGDTLLKEAEELSKTKDDIFKKVGAK